MVVLGFRVWQAKEVNNRLEKRHKNGVLVMKNVRFNSST